MRLSSPSSLELRRVSKSFGEVLAVDDVDLAVGASEFVAMLGPSGAGKSTLLALVAGFDRPDEGQLLFGGQDLSQVPAHRRNIGVVFQSYALFPHLSVGRNVEYPLRMRRVSRGERRDRVRRAVRTTGIEDLVERRPSQLSGGQQQRVALARAIVFDPALLLLDEPLSALDLQLREQMQFELASLQRRLGLTTVLVTHDQEEALSLADRVAVLEAGRIVQFGSPREVYEQPSDRFVAEFIGASNVLAVNEVSGELRPTGNPDAGRTVSIRADQLTINARDQNGRPRAGFVAEGVVETVAYSGAHLTIAVDIEAKRPLLVRRPGSEPSPKHGTAVIVTAARSACVDLAATDLPPTTSKEAS